jgi:signal transduction histidine kinase
MKKLALILIVAVVAPSLILGGLAIRSLRGQRFILERQQSLIYQGVADSLAKDIKEVLEEKQRDFARVVDALLATNALELAPDFDDRLRAQWPLADVGFVISPDGQVLSPSLFSRPEARQFRLDNDRFFCCDSVEVYWTATLSQEPIRTKMVTSDATLISKSETRSVAPTCSMSPGTNTTQSKVGAATAEFTQLMGGAKEGMVARFLRNQLKVMLWYRPTTALASPTKQDVIFGAQLDLPKLTGELRRLAKVQPAFSQEIAVAFLDDSARPVALSETNFVAPNWKRPFVASEIGEALPHWEVAVYLRDPAKLGASARTATTVLAMLICGLFAVIAVGCWFVVRCLRKELDLAQQKTDFVSNVSHELKTPLTSIRMFSELLAEGRVEDAEKRKSYSTIITAETARLTRLVNNVLDFARIERGEKKYNIMPCDATEVVRSTVESFRPHLQANGFALQVHTPEAPLMVSADRDALSQVLVNLVSNAEKYCNGKKEIEVKAERHNGTVQIEVLDRGTGVPAGCEEKIFEQFYRAHDSLTSGIQGSGLGLTLARQMARAHGGDVVYRRRDGGGSCFVIQLKSNN